MSKIPKLKIPLWVEIVYFALVAVVPATIAALEIFQSHSSAFKITFSSIISNHCNQTFCTQRQN